MFEYPSVLQDYLTAKGALSKEFRQNIRQFNNIFAFASFGANIIKNNGGPYLFKVHGQVYHQLSTLNPDLGDEPKFAQYHYLTSKSIPF